MNDAKISVVTVCFNSAETIEDTLACVANQRGANFEHVIVDGASSDATMGIVAGFTPEVARVISEPDRGLYDAMNKGMAIATGDVIGYLNSDDVYADSDVLRKISQAFSDGSIDACYGDLVYVQQDDISKVVRYWRSCPYSPGLIERGWMPAHPTFFIRRSILQELGGFNIHYRYHADFDLMVRLFLRRKIRCAYIPEILVRMRTGGKTNRSIRNIIRGNLESLESLRSHGAAVTPMFFVGKLLSRVPQFFRHPDSGPS
jgi:glycosyltransferase involved in cell wall biosynthesis